MKQYLLLCFFLLFASPLRSFDSSLDDVPLTFHDLEEEILIATPENAIIARLKESQFSFFALYTLYDGENAPLLHAKIRFFSNGSIAALYDPSYQPCGVLVEIQAPPAIFQNKNPIHYELYDSTYSTLAQGRRNLFKTKFRIYHTSPKKDSIYTMARSKFSVAPHKWHTKSKSSPSKIDIPPLLVLFLSAYHMHEEKRFECIKNNNRLVPMNLFLDLPVFFEKNSSIIELIESSAETNVADEDTFSPLDLSDQEPLPQELLIEEATDSSFD